MVQLLSTKSSKWVRHNQVSWYFFGYHQISFIRDMMKFLNLIEPCNCMIGSKVTDILDKKWVYTHVHFLTSYYSHLEKLKVKSTNYKKIPYRKVMKILWSQKLKFWLRNGLSVSGRGHCLVRCHHTDTGLLPIYIYIYIFF